MPRIPEASAARPEQTRPAPIGLAGAPFQAAADFFGEQAQVLFEAKAAEAAAQREVQYNTLKASVLTAARTWQDQAASNTDINNIESTANEGFQSDLDGILSQTKDPLIQRELAKFVPGVTADFAFGVGQIQRERQKESYKAEVPVILKNYRDAIAIAHAQGNDIAVDSYRQAAMDVIAGSPHHTPAEIGAMLEAFPQDVDADEANILLQTDPARLIESMDDPQQFTSMDVGTRIRFQNTALAKLDRAERASERAYKQRQEQTYTEALIAISEGRYTHQMLVEDSADLKGSQVRTLIDRIAKTEGESDDPNTLIQLESMVTSGDPGVFDALDVALRSNLIKESTYRSVLGDARTTAGSSPPERGYQADRSHIQHKLAVSPMADRELFSFQKSLQADALEEFRVWSIDNPNATTEDKRQKRDEIIDRFSVIRLDKMSLSMPSPRGYSGRKDAMDRNDLVAAISKLESDLHDGVIDQATYEREKERLAQWATIIKDRELQQQNKAQAR